MIEVKVENGNVEKALRVLKKIVNNEGDLQRLKDNRYYKKPSEIRREKKKIVIRNAKKNQKKDDKNERLK